MGEPMRKKDEMKKGDYLKPNNLGLEALGEGILRAVSGSRKPSTEPTADANPADLNDNEKALLWYQKVQDGKVDPSSITPSDYKKYKHSLMKYYGVTESDLYEKITNNRLQSGKLSKSEAARFEKWQSLIELRKTSTDIEAIEDAKRQMRDIEMGVAE